MISKKINHIQPEAYLPHFVIVVAPHAHVRMRRPIRQSLDRIRIYRDNNIHFRYHKFGSPASMIKKKFFNTRYELWPNVLRACQAHCGHHLVHTKPRFGKWELDK